MDIVIGLIVVGVVGYLGYKAYKKYVEKKAEVKPEGDD